MGALLQSLKNTFKKESRPLIHDQNVQEMRAKFAVTGSGRIRRMSLPPTEPRQRVHITRPAVRNMSNVVSPSRISSCVKS